MSDIDDVLNRVWDETRTDTAPALFNTAVFEKIARRKARLDLGISAVIAVAVWVIAMGLAPMLTQVFSGLGQLIGSEPVVIAGSMIVAAFGLLGLTRWGVQEGWWLQRLNA